MILCDFEEALPQFTKLPYTFWKQNKRKKIPFYITLTVGEGLTKFGDKNYGRNWQHIHSQIYGSLRNTAKTLPNITCRLKVKLNSSFLFFLLLIFIKKLFLVCNIHSNVKSWWRYQTSYFTLRVHRWKFLEIDFTNLITLIPFKVASYNKR